MIVWNVLFYIFVSCGNKEDECMEDSDCTDGQECVIEHDHEGDDHNHGGECRDKDTGGE